jgi:flagellum-specific peptidoglycan hydrolase FlgJ
MKNGSRNPKCCTIETDEAIPGKNRILDLEFQDYESQAASASDYASVMSAQRRMGGLQSQ